MSSIPEFDLNDEVANVSDYIPELAEGEDFETFIKSKSRTNSKTTYDSEKIIPLELNVDNQSVPIKKSKKSKKKKVLQNNKSNENELLNVKSEEIKVIEIE